MSKKDAIQSILTRLATIDVVNQDGSTTKMYSAVFNNQIENKRDGTGYAYQTPATFLECQFSEGVPIGGGATGYAVVFRLLIEHEHYNTEGTQDQDLIIFDIVDNVHRSMNGFKPDDCSPLYQSGTQQDYSHDNMYLFVLEYNSYFIDIVGSVGDTSGAYIDHTIDNPILEIEENIYIGVLPTAPPTSYELAGGTIIFGHGITTSIWRDGAGVPSDSLGNNGDYYLDTLTGDIYNKIAGLYVFRMTIAGGSGSGEIYSVFTIDSDTEAIGNVNKIVMYVLTNGAKLLLPTAVDNKTIYIVKNLDTANNFIDSAGVETIDGVTSVSLIPFQSITIISDNTNYNIH